jgi:hypothetical protein
MNSFDASACNCTNEANLTKNTEHRKQETGCQTNPISNKNSEFRNFQALRENENGTNEPNPRLVTRNKSAYSLKFVLVKRSQFWDYREAELKKIFQFYAIFGIK